MDQNRESQNSLFNIVIYVFSNKNISSIRSNISSAPISPKFSQRGVAKFSLITAY